MTNVLFIRFFSLTRRLAHTLVDRFGLIVGEYTHIHSSRVNVCVYVYTFQYWCNQISAWPYSTSVTIPKSTRFFFFFFFSPLSWLVLFSGSSMNIFFSQMHSLVSRWSSLNYTYQNKRVKRAVVLFVFFIIIHFFFLLRTTKHHSLITQKKKKKGKSIVSLSLYAYISTHRIKQNVMIERLLAPTPPAQLPELITEPPEVKKTKNFGINCRFYFF